MKRVLILASVASMIDQFNMPNIRLLKDMGYVVDVACNFIEGNTCSDEKIAELKKVLDEMGVRYYQIDFARKITNIKNNLKAFHQVEILLEQNHYEFLHCHSPIGGVVGRLTGQRKKTKVIYTAHGFHFYKGSPLKSWLIYYPVEKFCSKYTDILITINKEDYERALKKLHAKKTIYVPGVGIDTKKFKFDLSDSLKGKDDVRKSIGIRKDEFLLLSVGELNKNKNHSVVIRALGNMYRDLPDMQIHYVIAGKGNLDEELKKAAVDFGIENKVHLVGFQSNIIDWYNAADVFVFPSIREGLSVSLMEAMAASLPCVVSRIRGNIDLIDEDKGGFCFDVKNPKELEDSIKRIMTEDRKRMGYYNKMKVKEYDLANVLKILKNSLGLES